MDTSSFSNSVESNFSITTYGMRFRQKRTHSEMLKTLPDKSENIFTEEEMNLNRGSSKKYKQNTIEGQGKVLTEITDRAANINIKDKDDQNPLKKEQKKKDKIKRDGKRNLEFQTEHFSDDDSKKLKEPEPRRKKENARKVIDDSGDQEEEEEEEKRKKENQPIPANRPKQNFLLQKETESFKNGLNKLQTAFLNEKIKQLVSRVLKYCKKESLKDTKRQKVHRVLHFFKENDLKLDKQYPKETSAINFAIALFDVLLSKNDAYETILMSDNLNIGNLLLYYFSQRNLIEIGNLLFPIIEMNMNKANEIQKINFANFDNCLNAKKDLMLNEIYEVMKSYKKNICTGDTKSKFAEELKQNFFLNNAMELMQYKKLDLNNIFSFNYDKGGEIEKLFQTKPYYLVNCLGNTDINKKILKSNNDIIAQCIEKRFKIYKIQKLRNIFFSKIEAKVLDLNVYHMNSYELITDFLSDD